MGQFDPDICMAVGVVLAVLSVPSMLSAFIDRRAPRVATFTVIVAGCLMVYAVQSKPGVYSIQEIPNVFIRVAARVI